MFGVDVTILALGGLVVFAVGGIAYAMLGSRIAGEDQVNRRLNRVTTPQTELRARRNVAEVGASRRKSVQETLREIEAMQKAKAAKTTSPPLPQRLAQAGLNWSRQQYYIFSIIMAAIVAALGYLLGAPWFVLAGLAFAGGLGLPRWYIGRRRKKRIALFLDELPNSVDVIVRGVKAGLPLNDCLKVIAAEAREPLRSEFRAIIDAVQMGVPIEEAVVKLHERTPVPEANFFAIVIGIQAKVGGNLSEALGNLSKVLRDRKKMKAKVRAMSMEAKASAAIIGSLPPAVMGLVYLTAPDYISMLWTEPMGQIVMGVSLLWMTTGIFVMRKMINFDI